MTTGYRTTWTGSRILTPIERNPGCRSNKRLISEDFSSIWMMSGRGVFVMLTILVRLKVRLI
jgi:hypothetical protein